MDKLKILTINARGLQNKKKRHCVFTYLTNLTSYEFKSVTFLAISKQNSGNYNGEENYSIRLAQLVDWDRSF